MVTIIRYLYVSTAAFSASAHLDSGWPVGDQITVDLLSPYII